MADITAGAVKELRDRTGLGMMECKKALVEANGDIDNAPELVNNDAEGDGWLFKLRLSDVGELADLMDEAAYQAYVDKL